MSRAELLRVMRTSRYAVEASVTPTGGPQAAVVGIAVTDTFEIVFDLLGASRKAQNLRVNRRAALVLGNPHGGDEQTVQYEGLADEPSGRELEQLLETYFSVFPDGRQRRRSLLGLTYMRVTPTWIRHSNYNVNPPEIAEFTASDLDADATAG